MKIHGNEKGFTLVFSIILMLVLSISVPALVNWVRQESKDTVKIKRSTTAFHLAEAGVDQGVWKLQESQTTWSNAESGVTVAGYNGDVTYSLTFADGRSGNYVIDFSSGPSAGEVTVLAKGRDDSTKEIRAVQVVMSESGFGTYSIQAKKTSSFGAATSVEWGPIMSKTSIDSGGKNHPRLYSAGNVTGKDGNASADPNTDNVQWWSYKQDLPADPVINFAFYQSSATALGSSPDPQCGSYYKNVASFQFKGCSDTAGRVFYITGNCDFASGSGGNQVKADVICLGDFGVSGNGGGNLTENLTVPPEAWKEYGNDWAYYTTNFDPTCPHASYAAASAASYAPTGLTKTVSDIIVHGFIYTGGSQGLTGGGNGVLVGTLYSANNASMTTSNCTLYYDPQTASSVQVSNVVISRQSWKEVTGVSFP